MSTRSTGKRPAKPHSRKGARTQRVSIESRYHAWRRHNQEMARDSIQRLLKRPFASLLTMFSIAVAFVLPAMLWLVLTSVHSLDGKLDDGAQMTVYMPPGLSEPSVQQLAERVKGLPEVSKATLITAQQGLDEFQKSLGISDTLSLLKDNPLPATLIVTPTQHDAGAVQALSKTLQQMQDVDEVRLDLAWMQRLKEIERLGERIVLGLGILFGCGVVLIVGNTVRLAVESRRQEIEVVTLLGATQAFVRRPFLYTGAWYGLGGGILAVLLLTMGRGWLSSPIRALAESYGSVYTLPGLGFGGSLVMLMCSIILGLLGAWVAVGHHLSRIKPR